MSHNQIREWLPRQPRNLSIFVVARKCGWHIVVNAVGNSMSSALRPTPIAATCLPHAELAGEYTNRDVLALAATALVQMADAEVGRCPNL
jgi:hypothetical protein